jgi:hypothetical protein
MAQTTSVPVRTSMDLDVTAHCALTLPTCVEVIPDDQPQDSLGSMGPVQDPDFVEGQAEDVQVFHPSLYLVALFPWVLTCLATVLIVSFVQLRPSII